MKICPRCHKKKMYDKNGLNCLSRRDNKTYICNNCGNEEAFIDRGLMARDGREREFVKTHRR